MVLLVLLVDMAWLVTACGPARQPARLAPRERALPSWWPRVADPEDPGTWIQRYLAARGDARAPYLRRQEALSNLYRLRQRLRTESERGSASWQRQRERFRRLVVPPLLVALSKGGVGFVATLIQLAPADTRVVRWVHQLAGYLARPAPKRFGVGTGAIDVFNAVLPHMARAAHSAPERQRLLEVLEKLVAELCPGGKRRVIYANTTFLKKQIRSAAKGLARGTLLPRAAEIKATLNACR